MANFQTEIEVSQKLKEAVDELKRLQPDSFYNQTVKQQVSNWEESDLKTGILEIIAKREEQESNIINKIKE